MITAVRGILEETTVDSVQVQVGGVSLRIYVPVSTLGETGSVGSTIHLHTHLDVKEDSRYINKEVAVKENLCSLLSVPMCVKGKVVGVLNCYTSTPREFALDDINLLTAVANQAAVAIENTELLVKTRIVQEELETRKLVERAKDVLMRNRSITGEEAYRRIQRKSMNTRKNMREVAEAIILADLGEE